MGLRALLFGTKLKALVAVVGLLSASIGGAFALGVIGAPSVVAVENSFGDVTDRTTVVHTDLVVNNPNPIGVRLGGTTVNYTVRMNDVSMASGQKEGLQVGTGNTTLPFTTEMDNTEIPDWWVTHVRNGERTNVTVDARVRTSVLGDRQFDLNQRQQVETDIISQFNSEETRPVNGPSSPVLSNPMLYVNETNAAWGSVSEAETPIDMQFVAYNPQTQPYTVTEVESVIYMNEITVGRATTDQPYVIEGGTTETMQVAAAIDNSELDDWWVSHLERNQVTDLRIEFYATVELPTGNTIRVPLDQLTYERTIETDIFGTKGETSSSGSASDDEESTATPTAEDTPTPTPTPEGTPTPTDDGGLVDTDTDDGGLLAIRSR